ncbi:MAG: hypothetical protein KAT46_03470, partial [Deltaproteobacteria bacterium]|nr:hypothetical protein [Deltaproteobacteria bacterium]
MQKNSLSRISISLALVFFLTLVIIISLPTKSRSQGSSDAELLERRIEVTYSFSVSASELVKLDHRQGKVRVWVPYPLEVAEQEIFEGTINNQSVSLEDLRFDSEWGGGILYFEPRDFFEDFTFTMTFILHRKELKALANFQNKDKKNNEPDPDKVLELYDKYHLSDGINDRLARLSEKAV